MKRRGFTLIELMIVVAIIGILAAIAVPKFVEFVKRSKEAETKGHLGAIRSALSIYYSVVQTYPSWNDTTINPTYPDGSPRPRVIRVLTESNKYLDTDDLMVYRTEHHPETHDVDGPMANIEGAQVNSTGWVYGSEDGPDSELGRFHVNCTHNDSRGTNWSTY